jgi:hypothetical protein
MDKRDQIGQVGEALFAAKLTRFWGRPAPLFDVRFLGEKFEHADYLVRLIDAGPPWPIFFVQIKATLAGYTSGGKRLKVAVAEDELRGLASFPTPTYIVGIDVPGERGYIVSANSGSSKRIASLSTKFSIDDPANLQLLWDEVRAFWAFATMRSFRSGFHE